MENSGAKEGWVKWDKEKEMPTTGIEPVIFACRRWIQVQRISHYAKQASTCDWRSRRGSCKAKGPCVSGIPFASPLLNFNFLVAISCRRGTLGTILIHG